MNDYKIVTESTADLTPELIERFGITVIPMSFNIGGEEYLNYPDGRELSQKDFYNLIREGKMSTTSAVNITQFEECFIPILESGSDILYIAFSSGLSSTYNTAVIVAEQLKEKFPQRKILIADSLTASMGEGLLVCRAAQLKQDGMEINQLCNWVKKECMHLCGWFTVDDLMHLYRGGRLSAMSARIGTVMSIKPVLHVDDEGHLVAMMKVRGRKQAIEALLEKAKELAADIENNMVFISHADCIETALGLAGAIKAQLNPAEVIIGDIGPVIGSHTGPGAVALFFFGSKR